MFIHLDVESITDLYITLPQDMTSAPQKYTVHCLINTACECAVMNSPFKYYMFMEGSLSEPAVQYCKREPSLSCYKPLESNDATTVDNQLTVIWYANTVITEGDYHTISTPANGDHDFLCVSEYFPKGIFTLEMKCEGAFVSIRGTTHVYTAFSCLHMPKLNAVYDYFHFMLQHQISSLLI